MNNNRTSIGNELYQARKKLKLTLSDIQNKTKIPERYLKDIEINNFSLLPDTFYIKLFIVQYAEAVLLDGDELIKKYAGHLDTHIDIKDKNKFDIPSRVTKKYVSQNNEWPAMLITFLVLLILITIFVCFIINLK